MSAHEVFPSDHPVITSLLRDFRRGLDHESKSVGRVIGEGKFYSSVFPEMRANHTMVEWLSQEEWIEKRPGFIQRWSKALRLSYLPLSLMPFLLVSGLYLSRQENPQFLFLFLTLCCVGFFQFSCMLWNDYEDHLRGVNDPESTGGSGVVGDLWIPAIHLRIAAISFLVLSLLCGVPALSFLNWSSVSLFFPFLIIASLVLGASYSGWPFHYKYINMGAPLIFLFVGPIYTCTLSLLFLGQVSFLLYFALISLPFSMLALSRVIYSDVVRIPFDTMSGKQSLARKLGYPSTKVLFYGSLFAPFLSVIALCALGLAPLYSLFCLAFAPLALQTLRYWNQLKSPLSPNWQVLRQYSLFVHFAFGLVYALSFYWLR